MNEHRRQAHWQKMAALTRKIRSAIASTACFLVDVLARLGQVARPMAWFFKKRPAEEQRRQETLRENGLTILYGVAFALLFRSFLFEPFHIPSGSMRATLLVGDYILVNKFSYGYSRYSFPFGARINYFDDRIFGSLPERGDVVVFRHPKNTRIDYVKRVMALPGDRIQVRNGRVWLNGAELDYEKVTDWAFQVTPNRTRLIARFRETLPDGASHEVLDISSDGFVDNTPTYTVPDGHVFVMGDNRDDSEDSRYYQEVGFIPIENVLGRVGIIFFSFNGRDDVAFWEFWRYPLLFRTERFFKVVD